MPKFIAQKCKVVIDGTDFSGHAFHISTPEEAEQIDVSGFSATNTREFLQGTIDQSLECSFLSNFGTSQITPKLNTLFATGSIFPVYVQPDMNAGTSPSNPIYGCSSAQLFTNNGLNVDLNARGEVEAVFKAVNGASFAWGTTAP